MPTFLERPGYFPPRVLSEVRSLRLTDELFEGRSEAQGITIDGVTSQDLDDAIWLSKKGENHLVSVSIADVDSLVTKGSFTDQEAAMRLFTRYLRTDNRPMIPHPLSEDSLSLLEHQKRPTLTIDVELTPALEIAGVGVRETYMKSEKKFHYAEADAAMRDPSLPHHAMLRDSSFLAGQLLQKRREKGALAIYDLQQQMRTDEEGKVTVLRPDELHQSNILIQEFMILANEVVANFCREHQTPFLYRNHQAATVNLKRSDVMQRIFELLHHPELLEKDTHDVLHFARAKYSPIPQGHFGLNIATYSHFTSPIRRYVDLVNHRIVKAMLHEERPPYDPSTLNELSDYINESVRSVLDAKYDYFKKKRHNEIHHKIQTIDSNALHMEKPRDFSAMLERATKDHILNEAFEVEIRIRLREGKLLPIDVYHLLFIAPESWSLKADAKVALKEKQELSKEVILLLLQIDSNWRGYACKFHEVPNGFAAQSIIGVGDSLFSTPTYTLGYSKKDAEQSAAIALLTGYMDGTLVPAEQTRMPEIPLAKREAQSGEQVQNAISILSMRCAQARIRHPVITTNRTGGSDHAPIFRANVSLDIGGKILTSDSCEGPNKQHVREAAAKHILDQWEAMNASAREEQRSAFQKNPTTLLYEFCNEFRTPKPTVTNVLISESDAPPMHRATMSMILDGSLVTSGPCELPTKADARNLAAEKLLAELRKVLQKPSNEVPKDSFGLLMDFVQRYRYLEFPAPTIDIVQIEGSTPTLFRCTMSLGFRGHTWTAEESGTNKMEAKQRTAALLTAKMKEEISGDW